jgi:hypothetical protein
MSINRVVAHVLLPVASGSLFYGICRARGLRVFEWLHVLGLDDLVSSLRRSNLLYACGSVHYWVPDGMWIYAFTAAMRMIWQSEQADSAFRVIWCLFPITMALASEVGQGAGLISGTFDVLDLVAYVGGFLLACIAIPTRHRLNLKDSQNG